MTNQAYKVQVQSDYLSKITRAQPVLALTELIWNSLDADARSVDVSFEYNELDTLSTIIVRDDGRGIPHADAP
jgi:DNA mismatch repair ATPase MutL